MIAKKLKKNESYVAPKIVLLQVAHCNSILVGSNPDVIIPDTPNVELDCIIDEDPFNIF